MSAQDSGSGSAPGQRLHLELLSVPPEGGITVRWLANPVGILTHFQRGGGVACVGPSLCPTKWHTARTTWKGYAPVHFWRDAPLSDWLPAVLEVTERLAELVGDQVMRGQVWYLCRQVGKHRHKECTGHQVDMLPASALAEAFDVRGVVRRVYREPHVHFGAELLLPPRVEITPQQDGYVPPTAAAPPRSAEEKAVADKADHAKLKQILAKRKGGG